MDLEIKKLIAKGKFKGEVEFDYEPPADICMIPLCRVTDVKARAEYEIFDDDAVEITLHLSYKIVGQCSYCLKEAEKSVEFTHEATYLTEDDEENYVYDGFKLNMNTAVDDAILISQPNLLLCEGCAGVDNSEN